MRITDQLRKALTVPGHENRQPDPGHAHRRRFTRKYQRKRSIVKSVWIASGLLTIILGATVELIIAVGMTTTFIAFCILDETR